MEHKLDKYALNRLASDLNGYYSEMERARSEIVKGCFAMQEEAFHLQLAMLKIEVAKKLLFDMGIRFEWDGEAIKLFNNNNEQIA